MGADQILTVRPSPAEGIDFEYVIHNADGGEVEQCGNGARCFARYVHDKGLTGKSVIRVQTLAGLIAPELHADGRVTVDMGQPVLEPSLVPFNSADLVPARWVRRSNGPCSWATRPRSGSPPFPWATRMRCNWWTMWTMPPWPPGAR